MDTNPDCKRLVLIGAGSVKFTLGLTQDLIADGSEWELRLVDISPDNLDIARRLVARMVEAHDAPIATCRSIAILRPASKEIVDCFLSRW